GGITLAAIALHVLSESRRPSVLSVKMD
ncbi:MAG: hypothetical protein RL019_1899, partial [Pseudomonadota bacterium]